MKRFYEEYKLLISTETSYKSGTPHALVTGTEYCTQHMSAEVKFDYQKVYDREDTYHDVMGFYHTHPSGLTDMSEIDVETMTQWVKCLGKSLVCIIETDDSLKSWMCVKNESGQVTIQESNVSTQNDVNYDLWFEAGTSFWHPADFLVNGEYYDGDSVEEEDDELMLAIEDIQRVQNDMVSGFNVVVDTVQSLVQAMTKEEDDE